MTPGAAGVLVAAGIVGIMAFFTIAAAPTVFKVLPQQWARLYVRAFCPKYYAFLGVATTMAVLRVCASLFFISNWILTLRINPARDLGKNRVFGVLHGTRVLINLVQMAVLLGVLWSGS
jgi:hypothetical protein